MAISGDKKETTLSYRLDAKGLKDLRKEMDRAFDRKQIKAMTDQLLTLKSTMKGVAKEQAALTIAMGKVAEGSDAYKELEKQLDKVERRSQRARSAISALNGVVKNAGHGAFSQGFLQGLSPAVGQFIQRGPGMAPQFAGQVIGSGARGIIGAAGRAGSAMLQGAGPLSSLMSGIPVLGGIAAAAEGQAQSAVAYHRSRLEAAPFIGNGVYGFRGGGRRVTPGIPGSAATLGSSGGAAFNVGNARDDTVIQNAFGKGDLNDSGLMTLASKAVDRAMNGSKATPSAAAIAAEGVQGIIASHQARHTGGKQATPGTPDQVSYGADSFEAFMREGGKAAMNRQQTIQAAGEFGRTVGGGRFNNAGAFGQTQAARALFGVDVNVGAGLFHQQQAGRGGMGGDDALASSIGDALKQGLEGSDIGEYLERLVSLQEQAAQSGIKVSAEGFGNLARGFSALGMAGPQAARLAGEMQGFGARVAGSGARGPMDIALLRSLGFNAKGGGDSYIDSLLKAEQLGSGGMNAGNMFKMISGLSGGGNSKRAGFSLQRALGSAGIKLGLQQAIDLAGAAQGGEGAFTKALSSQGFTDSKGKVNFGAMSGADLSAGLKSDAFNQLAGVVRSQNVIDNELLAAGEKILPNVQALEKAAANLTDAVAGLSKTGAVTKITGGIVDVSGLLKQLVDMLRDSGMLGSSSPR